MKSKEQNKKDNKKWKVSFQPFFKYSLLFCILFIIIVMASGTFMTLQEMKKNTDASMDGMKLQIEYRINQSVSLLQSLASQERFYSTSVPTIQKVRELDKLSENLGYLMMCYVDADLLVYDESGPADLSSRAYLQKLFVTGTYQVTDSFAAGSDGVTLNYTVAVPLIEEGKVSGCLFSAIYFDEIETMLKEYTKQEGIDAQLIGSEGQIMSSTDNKNYGDSYMDLLKTAKLLETNVSEVETGLLNHGEDSFWSLKHGNIYLTSYAAIKGTNWNIIAYSDFHSLLLSILPGLLPIAAIGILLFILMMGLIERNLKSQLKIVDMLVSSVEKLEQKLYQNERPDNVDFNEVLHLTSTGLSDGLTGVVTRSVFMNKLPAYIEKRETGKITVLCFVDLDNLKLLNDTYGHEIGDISLKSIGYVLREFEKKYDGLVGRYGGDEFILLLSDMDSEEELQDVLTELARRMHIKLVEKGQEIEIQCSVGVSILSDDADEETLIKEADEALYFVKQNGKGYYNIYQEMKCEK